jgi:hypothetical protein
LQGGDHANRTFVDQVRVDAVLVAALWLSGVIASKAGIVRRRVVLAWAWGFVVLGLGFWQGDLLVGERHRIIKVLHLIAGMAALRQIFWIVKQVRGGASGRHL